MILRIAAFTASFHGIIIFITFHTLATEGRNLAQKFSLTSSLAEP